MNKATIPFIIFIVSHFAVAASNDRSTDVERAARDYRIQVYNTFRSNRSEFERRQAIGRKAFSWWNESDQRESSKELVLRWFSAATAASRPNLPGERSLLPEMTFVLTTRPLENKAQVDLSTKTPMATFAGAGEDTHPGEIKTRSDENPDRASLVPSLDHESRSGDSQNRDASHLSIPAVQGESTSTPRKNTPRFDITKWINIDDLRARVHGFNLTLAAVNEQLGQRPKWSEKELVSLVEDLERLSQRGTDLKMYLSLDALKSRPDIDIDSLESMKPTLRELVERLRSSAREQAEANSSAFNSDQLKALVERLTTIRNRETSSSQ